MEAKSSLGDSLSAISVIIKAVYDIISGIRGFFYRTSVYWRNRKILKKYKKDQKAVKDGDVDDLNDQFTK